jgi:hypothetical protein
MTRDKMDAHSARYRAKGREIVRMVTGVSDDGERNSVCRAAVQAALQEVALHADPRIGLAQSSTPPELLADIMNFGV